MLKLKNISPNARMIYNESDYYVKIKIIFEKETLYEGVCYWNAYKNKNTLVQIGMTTPTGAIYKLICIFHATAIHQIHTEKFIINKNIPTETGLPLFETYFEKYQEDYYHLNEEIDFEIYVSENSITIVFSLNAASFHVSNDPIIFGFDSDNNLCYIHIRNMTLNNEGFLEQI